MEAVKLLNKASTSKVSNVTGKNLTDAGKNDASLFAACILSVLKDSQILSSKNSESSVQSVDASLKNIGSEANISEKIASIKNIENQLLDIIDLIKKSGTVECLETISLLEKLSKHISLESTDLDIYSIIEIASMAYSAIDEVKFNNFPQEQNVAENLEQIKSMTANMLGELVTLLSKLIDSNNKPANPENIVSQKYIATSTLNKNTTKNQHKPSVEYTGAENKSNIHKSLEKNAMNQLTINSKEPLGNQKDTIVPTQQNDVSTTKYEIEENLKKIETLLEKISSSQETKFHLDGEKSSNSYKTNSISTQQKDVNTTKYGIEENLKKIETLLEKISSSQETKFHLDELDRLIKDKTSITNKDLEKVSLKEIEVLGNSDAKSSAREVSSQFLQEIKNFLEKYGMKFDSNDKSAEEKNMNGQLTNKNKEETATPDKKPFVVDLTSKDLQGDKPVKETIKVQVESNPVENFEQISANPKTVEQKESVFKSKIFDQIEKNIFKAISNSNNTDNTKGNMQVKQFMLNLEPKELGSVRVMLEFSKNEMRAVIKVENEDVKTVVRENLPRLRESLQVNGINVAEMYVDVNDKNSNFFKEFAKKGTPRQLNKREDTLTLDEDSATQISKKLFADSKYETIV